MTRFLCAAGVVAALMMPVQALASGSCTSLAAPTVGFGTMINPGNSNVTAITMVSVQCTSGAAYSILLDGGLHASGSGSSMRRSLASGANVLPYDIYSDAAHSLPWGNGINIGAGVAAIGTASTQHFPMYSILNVPLTAAPGTYGDTVTITLSF